MIDFSSEKYIGSTGHIYSWYSQRRHSEDANGDWNSQRLGYKSSALAVELNDSKPSSGKELSLSRWCIESLYIYHFSSVIDFSSEKHIGSTGHRYSWYQQRRYSEDANGKTQTRNPLVINPSALAIELNSSKASSGKELSLSRWCVAYLLCIHIYIIIIHTYIFIISYL